MIAIEDGFQGPGKPFENPGRALQLTDPFAFGTVSYFPGFLGLPLCVEGLHEKGGSPDHALAHLLAGFLIMLKEGREISRGHSLPDQPAVYGRGMVCVGARQRCQHSGCGPARNPTGFDGIEDLIGQGIEQAQSPIDPARVLAESTGHLSLGETVPADELTDNGGFFHCVPPSLHTQELHQGLVFSTIPHLRHHRFPAA